MSENDPSDRYALVRIVEVKPTFYSLETAANLTDVHPEMLRYYCRLGVFGDERARSGAALVFDDDALYELRRFEHFRKHHGVNRRTLRLLCDLWREVEHLRNEVRFLRGA
jgi:DNA-binding transcriptional MerR regulator